MRHKYEVADILRSYLLDIKMDSIPMDHYRTLDALSKCRTAALGGHIDCCDSCGYFRMSYNSCRNRHCPKCQSLNKEMWIIMQEDMLLPVAYYHVVFTIPHELNLLCMYNPNQMYSLLFASTWHVLKTMASDKNWLGAKTAATMVLHTWSQTLHLHPHLHCIVPNGGLTKEGKWVFPKKGKQKFLFPIKAMQKLIRGYFMEKVLDKIASGEIYIPEDYYLHHGGSYARWKDILYRKNWVVYTKKPFSGVKHVVDYLARYSHRVAITNQRILHINNTIDRVKISYKDYRDRAKKKEMEMTTAEFVRRFSLHLLPKGFRKVRQYGFTANASKGKSIALARKSLGLRHRELMDRAARKCKSIDRLAINKEQCPHCKGKMETILTITCTRPPPSRIINIINNQNKKK